MAGNGENLAVMQAELAGEAQDLLGLARHREHNCQCIFRHIIGDREIRVINMVAEFSDIRKETGTVFCQRS